jgi:hypothetical protein
MECIGDASIGLYKALIMTQYFHQMFSIREEIGTSFRAMPMFQLTTVAYSQARPHRQCMAAWLQLVYILGLNDH